jgi:phage tail P2-like protein
VLGGNFNVARLVVTPADDTAIPPVVAVMESDTDFRLRIQQAFEGLSVAGSVGAYEYHGRSADGRVADISVTSPSPSCVTISVLSRENNGIASDELLAVVRNALNAEDVRPVADRVTVQSADIVDYQIDATLYLYPGPESEPIRAAAVKNLEAYISAQHRLGRDIRLSAIYAALHVVGVQRVELAAPHADIVLDNTQASFCTRYTIAVGVLMNDSRLLPVGSSPLEVAAARACAEIEKTPVSLRTLWNPDTCPANLLPWLAWAFSVDRWDEKWPELTKRAVIRDAWFIHCHKGTLGAVRRVVEPLGYLINITEWWETSDPPGTFRLDIGVLESGITEEMYYEIERLIADAKPASRHLIGLNIIQDIPGWLFTGGVACDGDIITVYPG